MAQSRPSGSVSEEEERTRSRWTRGRVPQRWQAWTRRGWVSCQRQLLRLRLRIGWRAEERLLVIVLLLQKLSGWRGVLP